jgi:hypothetical protein
MKRSPGHVTVFGRKHVTNLKPIASAQEGMTKVDTFSGPPEAFVLAVPAGLLDPLGVNMARITDRVLARGWQPDGFEQHDGYMLYRYRLLE